MNEVNTTEKFTVIGNIIHRQSAKCKRVTRSVLASEIYGLVNGFDLGYVIGETLRTIANRLNLPPIPVIVCTDSYSLYDCIVKLGTTTEKGLMIDLVQTCRLHQGPGERRPLPRRRPLLSRGGARLALLSGPWQIAQPALAALAGAGEGAGTNHT